MPFFNCPPQPKVKYTEPITLNLTSNSRNLYPLSFLKILIILVYLVDNLFCRSVKACSFWMVVSSLGVCLSLKKALRMTIIINYHSGYNNQLICPKLKRKPFSLNKSQKSYTACNSPQHHVNLSSAFSHTYTGRAAILYHIFPIFLRWLPAQEPRGM